MSNDGTEYLSLYEAGIIPMHVCLASFTWGLHDYFATLEDEICHIWPSKLKFADFMFFWIRYYTLALLLFDVVQIHVFAIPGVPSEDLCLAMDIVIRVTSALSLWAVEIILQLRVFAIYSCSKRIGIINLVFFLASIAAFFWILVHNAQRRRAVIASAIDLSVPGCPSIHTGIEWAQWIPATIYEGILFGYAACRTYKSNWEGMIKGRRISLYSILLRDNLLYFFSVALLLILNNLMVAGTTHIPWFSYGPFHAAVGILTTRMVINIRKAATRTRFWSTLE